jgi:proline iminopeptidase
MARRNRSERARRVRIGAHEVVTYSYGDGEEALFLLNGGPGLPCDHLRDPLLRMVAAGYRVVTYDQLGCGASDKPRGAGLWTIARYAEEVETVRTELGLGRVHLLGYSWGGWLGIEYAVTFPEALKSVVLSNTCGDMSSPKAPRASRFFSRQSPQSTAGPGFASLAWGISAGG